MTADLDIDLQVTWLRPDGSTVDLPACVCFRADDPEQSDVERRSTAAMIAVEMNLADFGEDLPDGSVPTRWTVMAGGFRAEVPT